MNDVSAAATADALPFVAMARLEAGGAIDVVPGSLAGRLGRWDHLTRVPPNNSPRPKAP